MQIRSRLTLQFTLLVSAILLLAFLSLYFFTKEYSRNEFYKRLKEKAITSAILLLKVDQIDSTLLKIIDHSKRDILLNENISILNESSKELYTNNDSIQFDIPPPMIQNIKEHGEQTFVLREFDVIGIQYKYKGENYVVLAGAVDAEGHSRLDVLKRILLLLLFFLVAIVAFAGWIYSGRALKPIKDVMNEVQNISTVDLSQRLHGSEKSDEIGNLVSIFNGLLNRIENAFNLQKTFVANVSHELKNPLTKITSQLEVTILKDRDIQEYKELIQSVLDDIKELNQLSTSLLDLASLNQDNISFSTSRLRIDEVLWEVRESVQSLNSNYRVDVHIVNMPENEEDLYLDANPYLLKTALQNLVENACKFSDDHTATISLLCSKSELEIRLFDNGPGIEKKELLNVFQPFYRANNSSRIKGHGIGLSLSQRIISIHKGTIEIESSLGEGTQVTVIFDTKDK